MKIREDILPTLISKGIVIIDNIVIGAKVKRGPDWKWDDQDGGFQGVILELNDDHYGWVLVRWPHRSYPISYRIGAENKYDLEYV